MSFAVPHSCFVSRGMAKTPVEDTFLPRKAALTCAWIPVSAWSGITVGGG